MDIKVIKSSSVKEPKVSVILLDWSCRESYFSLDWLNKQDIDRSCYELIWVELYSMVKEEVISKVDTVIECNQKGIYHKHKGYNAGLLQAKGDIITICDSDALFPPDFIASIISSFKEAWDRHENLVLMHYEWRTASRYPNKGLANIEQLKNFTWDSLWSNVGACMSVMKEDAVRFGGFDEHRSFRGYFCGPYDLGWRLINAGFREHWHDKKTALWHFSHPNPCGEREEKISFKLWREIKNSHIEGHALSAVTAFAKGKILPIKENKTIFKLRKASRAIATDLEKKYSILNHLTYHSNKQKVLSAIRLVVGIISPKLRNYLRDCYYSMSKSTRK